MTLFLAGIAEAATGTIGVITAGMAGMATAVLANEIVMFAVGVGLLFTGIKFLPKMIGVLRK